MSPTRKNQTALAPDYFIEETEDWLVFPHELNGLTDEEIARNKPYAAEILRLKEKPD